MECSTIPAQSPDVPGSKDVASGVNTRVSAPPTPTDEQMVPNSDDATVECSCGFNVVCTSIHFFKNSGSKFT